MHPTPVEIEAAISKRIADFDREEIAAGRKPIHIAIGRLVREGINLAKATKDAEEARKHNQRDAA